ncbi:hypothetical protein, partial [Pseudomonas sp. 69_B]|uniref:hypothetical protein n=2 Tax=Pseudomonas TaxID=286 RepID=UPI001A9F0A29
RLESQDKQNPRQTSGLSGVLFFGGLGGLWADRALEVLGVYPFLRVLRLAVPLLQRVTFADAQK